MCRSDCIRETAVEGGIQTPMQDRAVFGCTHLVIALWMIFMLHWLKTILYAIMYTYKIFEGTCKKLDHWVFN